MPRTPHQTTPEPVERLVSRSCGWCGAEIPYSGKGRPRAYCSKAHRNRAWELRTAATRAGDGTKAAGPVREVIERTTTVEKRVVVPGPPAVPVSAAEWTAALDQLAAQLLRDGGKLRREHWHHRKLYRALIAAATALGDAYPGGLDNLAAGR